MAPKGATEGGGGKRGRRWMGWGRGERDGEGEIGSEREGE